MLYRVGITSTYKALLSSSDQAARGEVSSRVLRSYAIALDPHKKELSSAEGLLVAHSIFASTRDLRGGLDKTGNNCFTGLGIRRIRGGQEEAEVVEAIKSSEGGHENAKSKSITMGKGGLR